MMESIWKQSAALPAFPSLEGDRETDVLIVGGGLAGLLCAHRLTQAGVRCVLVEGRRICGGITANTTAKITSQHGLIYGKLLKKFGREAAGKYWEANTRAIEEFRILADGIACDFESKDHMLYATASAQELEKEARALESLGIPFDIPQNLKLPFPVAGAIRFRDQAQFHPLKFAAGIAAGMNIYEHTPVKEFLGNTAVTDKGQITALKILIATHFPMLNKHGSFFLKLYQQRSYVLAAEHAMDVEGMYLAAEEGGFSFRNQGTALLIGQGSQRTGKKSDGWRPAEELVRHKFPGAAITARWANQDCMTLDGLPYIGQYGKGTPDLYVATGFNKWGMTNSMAAAMIVTDLILGKDNPWADLFSPQRSMAHPQLLCNGAESLRNLITPTKPRCPHLGCALKWNPQEQSWDCPCHGSRFDREGKLLDNPATGDLTEKKRRP